MQSPKNANKPPKQVTKLINMLEVRLIFTIEEEKIANIL